MSDAESWGREQWEKLNQEELRYMALNFIRDHLKTISSFEASYKVKLLELPRIFDCLNSCSDPKEINTACEVLELCFANLSIGYVAETARDNILKSLVHTNVNVRQMAIKEVHRIVCSDSKLIPLPEYMEIAIAVVKCISDDDLTVSVKAMDIVTQEAWLQYPQLVTELKNILNGNSSNRCKCYEVIVNIAKKSPEKLDECIHHGFLNSLISELTTNDVLLQLNILELLANLAVVPHGLKFLVQNEVLKILSDLVANLDGNPLANILVPGLMRFFGNIAYTYPTEIFNNFPSIIEALFDGLLSNNVAILPTALDTLGYVGSTVEGKLALGALGHVLITSLNKVGSYIKNSSTDIRIRALHCADNLIGVRENAQNLLAGPIDHRVTLMTREWFREFSATPPSMEVLFGMCKNPFPEIKLAALGLLASVCQHQWGEELVMNTPGLLEYLLDRSVEHEKESKHSKYEIIKQLSKSSVFTVHTQLKLNQYVQEGPFYVQGITEVAIEGD